VADRQLYGHRATDFTYVLIPAICIDLASEQLWSKRLTIGIRLGSRDKKIKTYNRRDSQMVTHSSTSRPVQCLCMAERTGCPVLTDLWSYVLVLSDMVLV
jgi:hypothetical protein